MIARVAESITLGAIAAVLFALAIALPVVARRLFIIRRTRAELARRRAVRSIRATMLERDRERVRRVHASLGSVVFSSVELYAAVVECARNEEGATPSIERLKAIDVLCRSEIWLPGHSRPWAS